MESITKAKNKIIVNTFIDFNKKVNKIIVNKDARSKFLAMECKASYKNGLIQSKTPIKVTFFRKDKNDDSYKVEIIKRSLNFDTKHEFKLETNSKKYDYFAGIINQVGESKIIKFEP